MEMITKNQKDLVERIKKGDRLWFDRIGWVYYTRNGGWHKEHRSTVDALIQKRLLIKSDAIGHRTEYVLSDEVTNP